MTIPAIRVQQLGKQYAIGAREAGYTTFREALSGLFTNPIKRMKSLSGLAGQGETFWALRDISFEVQPGDVVGIIGHNGAGKSTLLKILSQITEPTEGRIELTGRIASLLEVGTGFHYELTGRDNIYLNGSILGMSRHEIRRKFDEIVAFAEVERFLDLPVKRYSSGMSVRLAFSVAAHLDPEILVIDEVLAVGDQAFQNKCMKKMSGVAASGRTILFVSHQMAAIEALCSSAILLSQGRMVAQGKTAEVVQKYLSEVNRVAAQPLAERLDRRGTGSVRFTSASFSDGNGQSTLSFQCGGAAAVTLGYENRSGGELKNLRAILAIDSDLGQRVLHLDSTLLRRNLDTVAPGGGRVTFKMPKLALVPGRYRFTAIAFLDNEVADWIGDAGYFYVDGGNFFGTGMQLKPGDGLFAMEHEVSFAGANETEARD